MSKKRYDGQAILQEVYFDFLQFTSYSAEEKLNKLQNLTNSEIKVLIWNLLTSEKYRSMISYNTYSEVLDMLIGYIQKNDKDSEHS